MHLTGLTEVLCSTLNPVITAMSLESPVLSETHLVTNGFMVYVGKGMCSCTRVHTVTGCRPMERTGH